MKCIHSDIQALKVIFCPKLSNESNLDTILLGEKNVKGKTFLFFFCKMMRYELYYF